MKQGIDVSKWQPQIDWQKVKADGIDFAIIRVGFCYNNGALKLDSAFTQHIKGALAAGLDVGIYLYSYAATVQAARRAAQEVIRAVKPYKLTYPIAFDIEYESIYTGGSKQTNTEICKAFLDEVEAALDDTNLRRLAAYIDSLRDETQLIMITHQRRTMEMADVLFGVSMQGDGVTKVISQKLDQALKHAE